MWFVDIYLNGFLPCHCFVVTFSAQFVHMLSGAGEALVDTKVVEELEHLNKISLLCVQDILYTFACVSGKIDCFQRNYLGTTASSPHL